MHSLNLLHLGQFLLLIQSNCIFPPLLLICMIYISIRIYFPLLCICIIFTSTTCLQSLNLYFTMGRKKLTPIVTPKTLESMIEYTLISNILEKLCEMTIKPLEYLKDDTQLFPIQHFTRNHNMENIMEKGKS